MGSPKRFYSVVIKKFTDPLSKGGRIPKETGNLLKLKKKKYRVNYSTIISNSLVRYNNKMSIFFTLRLYKLKSITFYYFRYIFLDIRSSVETAASPKKHPVENMVNIF